MSMFTRKNIILTIPFKTYIYTLGRNKAIDYVRKQSKLKVIPFERDNEILLDEDSLEEKSNKR